MLYPEIAAIDCNHCQLFAYDLKTGKPWKNGADLIPRGNKKPPCHLDSKACRKVAPGYSDLTAQNRMVLEHYLECRATGRFPDDVTVRKNASLLDSLLRQIAHDRQARNVSSAVDQIGHLVLAILRRRR